MGKGDKRTKKGKIWRSSYGVSRPRVARNQAIVILSKEEKEAQIAAAAAKEAKKAEKAAAPKKAAKKAAPKKAAAPKKVVAKKEDAPKKEKSAPKKASGKADDLKKIEGIGPKIAETLVAAGISSYAELSKTKSEKIAEIIAGVRGNHVTDTWPEQAALAAADKWDELKVLQDALDGGVKK